MNRKLLSGWVKLVTSNAAAGALNLVGLAIAARALDVDELGIILIIQAYARVVDGLFNFQSVNVLTRFLAEAEHGEETERFRGLVKAGILVDGLTALVATLVAILILPVLGTSLGVPSDWTSVAMLYSLVILTRIFGVSEAVLRCFDRFWAIGLRGTLSALLIVLCSLGAWWADAGAATFLVLWLPAEATAIIVFLICTYIVRRQQGVTGIWRAKARAAVRRSQGFWGMLWQTNLTFGIRIVSQDADVVLAGAVLGPAAASLLRAAKAVSGLVAQFGRPLQQVVSAPVARLSAQGQFSGMLRYSAKISALAGFTGLLLTISMVFFADWTLRVLFGDAYVEAATVTVILFLARNIYLTGITIMPTMLAVNLGKEFLYSVVIGTSAFLIVVSLAIGPLGLLGVAAAHLAFEAVLSTTGWLWICRRVSDLTAKQLPTAT